MPRLIAHLKFACKGAVCPPDYMCCGNVVTVPAGTTRLTVEQRVHNRYGGSLAGRGTTEELSVRPVGTTTCAVCSEERAIELTARAVVFSSERFEEPGGASAKLLLARLIEHELPCCHECRERLVRDLRREGVSRHAYAFHGWGARVDPRCVGSTIPCDERADVDDVVRMARDRVHRDANGGFAVDGADVDLTEEAGPCLTEEEFLARFHKRDEDARRRAASPCWYTFETVV